MAISRHGGKTSDSVGLHEVVDFSALYIGGAVISQRGCCITALRPRLPCSVREVLQIGTHVERRSGVAPNLPGRLRVAQALEEPSLLLGAKNCLRGLVFAEILYLDTTETN